MPSDELQNIITLLRANRAPDDITPEEFREVYEQLGTFIPAADDVEITEVRVGGVPARRFAPADGASPRAVLYLHGGGYAIGSSRTHTGLTSHLARAARATVTSLDYRLAPEHPYPAALDDAIAAYDAILDAGTPADQVVIAGDSAGGGLALALAMRVRDEGGAAPAGAVLISPWVDLTQSGDSMTTVTDDPMVNLPELERWADYYTAGGAAASVKDDAYVSPLFGDLAGLPPMLVHVGTVEALLDDARRLAERATGCGADLTLSIAPGMIHVWHFFAGVVPEAGDAIAEVAAWVIARTS